MRILLDSNILIRALVSAGGPAARLLEIILEDEDHILILSPYLLDELTRVLRSPRLQLRWPVTDSDASEFCDSLTVVAELVHLIGPIAEVSTDPADNAVLQTAIEGRADVLCTRDRHFWEPGVLQFAGANHFFVCDDLELLKRLQYS